MRKATFVALVLTIMVASLTGCGLKRRQAVRRTQVNAIMQSWVGQPVSVVIQRLGPATRAVPDGKGGTIYTWAASRTSTRSYSIPITKYGTIERTGSLGQVIGQDTIRTTENRTYTTTTTRSASVEFWANKDGIIYNWRWQTR